MNRPQWRVTCKKLHEFVSDIDAAFREPQKLAWLLGQVAEAVDRVRSCKDAETDWHRRRREYFETTAANNLDLLNGRQRIEGLQWQEYERLISVEDVVALPASLRCFLDVVDDGEGHLVAVEYSNGENRLLIPAWAPIDLLPCNDPTPNFPLPPGNIGRDYRLHENCFVLAVLHDADGGFEPFVPDGHELGESHFRNFLACVRVAGLVSTADESWVPELEPLLDRVIKESTASLPASGEAVAHSSDFRSVRWYEAQYSFTADQSHVVRILWEHWRQGTPDVGDESLLSAVDPQSPPNRMNVLFRKHPAWGTMIVAGQTKGTHRLVGVAPENL